ncbi:MAG: MBL fold metallo-hydrolase, partial [Thermomicrobiales bacterium]|nr:MBL fold metallo-hydrolase [Thermomicrobiales bacterium]
AILEPLQREHVLSYLIAGSERAMLIDTGTGGQSMRALVALLTDLPVFVLNSHSHWDHVGSNHEFDDIAIHVAEAHELAYRYAPEEIAEFFGEDSLLGPLPPGRSLETIGIGPSAPTTILQGGERLDLGGRSLTAVHTPGHAPGLLSLLDEENGVLFSTDTAYPGPLYAFSDETDIPTYIRSMELLADLAPSLRYIHPSHNADLMPVSLLPRMRDALIDIQQGKAPDRVDETKATYEYEGFGVYAPLPVEQP